MSTTGLQSSLYREIRDLAELFDAALIALKTESVGTNSDHSRQLGAILVRLAHPQATAPHDQLLSSLLVGYRGPNSAKLRELGNALVAGNITPRIVDDLEALAGLLEQERAGTFAKIRGRR